jgi:AcrR family transcriptional regulator
MTLKADTRRAICAAKTHKRVIDAGGRLFRERTYGEVTMRTVATEAGVSTGAIFAHFSGKEALYLAVMGVAWPWRPIVDAPKDGALLVLLVDYSADDADHALEDATLARTIGWNELANTGDDIWHLAGWSWTQDVYCDGFGRPVAFMLLDDIAPIGATAAWPALAEGGVA